MAFNPQGEVVQDMQTGESVERAPVPDQYAKLIEQTMIDQENQGRQFVVTAQQLANMLNQFMFQSGELQKGQKKVQDTLIQVCKDCGIRKDDWQYNPALKCMELKKPPIVPPLPEGVKDGQGNTGPTLT